MNAIDRELLQKYEVGDIFYHPKAGVKCTIKTDKTFDHDGRVRTVKTIVKYNGRKPAVNEENQIDVLLNALRSTIDAIQVREEELEHLEGRKDNHLERLEKLGVEEGEIRYYLENGRRRPPKRTRVRSRQHVDPDTQEAMSSPHPRRRGRPRRIPEPEE